MSFVVKIGIVGGALLALVLLIVGSSRVDRRPAPALQFQEGLSVEEVGSKISSSSAMGEELMTLGTTTAAVEVLKERPSPFLAPSEARQQRIVIPEIPKEVFTRPLVSSPPGTPVMTVVPISSAVGTPLSTPLPAASPSQLPTVSPLPPLDEARLLAAVVKIQCPVSDGFGKYIGSGFALEDGVIVTAAHVIMDSASATCEVIFPKERRPIRYLKGSIFDFAKVKPRHDTQGIDLAFIKLKPLEAYPEAQEVFSRYPAAPYPVCKNPAMLGDKLLHFGYPSNYLDQNYLSMMEGEAVAYADIKGIKEQLSQDQTFTFKSPVFSFNEDESRMHAYMVSRVASFYGDSGGMAFNATKQCILGPHRGGTIGRSAGENYSIFLLLGWEGLKEILE